MTIPSHAKKVFSGVVFDIYQWKETLYDGTQALFEKAVRANGVKVIAVTESGNILLNHEEQPGKLPFVSLPGGLVEQNEDLETAARRELLEETGYSATILEHYRTYPMGFRVDSTFSIYIARNIEKITEPELDAGEKIETYEYPFDEFLEMVLDGKIRQKDLVLDFLAEYRKDPTLTQLRNIILGNNR